MLTVLALSLVLASAAGASVAPAGRPPEIGVRAADFALELPDRFESGLVAFVYENAGQEIHNVLFVRLNEGKTIEDFKMARGPQDLPNLGVPSGGTTSVLPGQRRRFVNEFAPGTYVAFSTSTASDGVPDVQRGMFKQVMVTTNTRLAKSDEPQADLTVTLSDAVPIPLPATVRAGPHTWKITVAGTTVHEMTISRFLPGKTLADVEAWLQGGRKGPPMSIPVAGMQLLPPGQSGWLLFDLESGGYAANDIPGGGPKNAKSVSFNVVSGAAPARSLTAKSADGH